MTAYASTFFIGPETSIRGGTTPIPFLCVEPDGRFGPGNVTFQFSNGANREDVLAAADRFLAVVTAWRDEIAADAEQQRTASDELEAARAEIARLKAEAGESDE